MAIIGFNRTKGDEIPADMTEKMFELINENKQENYKERLQKKIKLMTICFTCY
ncbi:CAT RNA binding domain-containing protein [Peribacillus saganii]|uniref:CAT RNA binding domain-containing protein n=1 Tax=Peribacillus saganii TaxID=2303992 RepID=UPI001F38A6D6|nr:CAT RNA binding domain-containing protein [Peribacillus saganii]